MKIFQGFEALENINNPVLTIGTFDGVHLGHHKIIKRLNFEAEKIGGESVLFTFNPHPRIVLYPENHGLKLIQTQAEKNDKLRRYGLDNIIVHPFTKEFSRLSAIEFVRDYLVNKLHVKKLVIGYDHQFGKNREGNLKFLLDVCDTYDFQVLEIDAEEIDEVNISSTKIRKAIKKGDIKLAQRYLGEPFELHGKIIEGQSLGRQIGFPTANLDLESVIKLIPSPGVYAVNVRVEDKIHNGIANMGIRPTVGGTSPVLEVHIFNFSKDIYAKRIEVEFFKKIREEKKFKSIDLLKLQIQKDIEQAKKLLS